MSKNTTLSPKDLFYAAKRGQLKRVQECINSGVDINCTDLIKNTPTQWASLKGHLPVVHLLHSAGADIQARNKDGDTALIVTCFNGHSKVVSALLAMNVDVNEDNRGFTGLHNASQEGHVDTVQCLLQAGADLNRRTKQGATALHLAAQRGHLQVCEELHNRGADLQTRCKQGLTPFIVACNRGQLPVVQWLLSKGCAIHVADDDGNTGLHNASGAGKLETVKYLVENMASVDNKNNHGSTPLMLAVKNNHTSVVKLLTETSQKQINKEHQKPGHPCTVSMSSTPSTSQAAQPMSTSSIPSDAGHIRSKVAFSPSISNGKNSIHQSCLSIVSSSGSSGSNTSKLSLLSANLMDGICNSLSSMEFAIVNEYSTTNKTNLLQRNRFRLSYSTLNLNVTSISDNHLLGKKHKSGEDYYYGPDSEVIRLKFLLTEQSKKFHTLENENKQLKQQLLAYNQDNSNRDSQAHDDAMEVVCEDILNTGSLTTDKDTHNIGIGSKTVESNAHSGSSLMNISRSTELDKDQIIKNLKCEITSLKAVISQQQNHQNSQLQVGNLSRGSQDHNPSTISTIPVDIITQPSISSRIDNVVPLANNRLAATSSLQSTEATMQPLACTLAHTCSMVPNASSTNDMLVVKDKIINQKDQLIACKGKAMKHKDQEISQLRTRLDAAEAGPSNTENRHGALDLEQHPHTLAVQRADSVQYMQLCNYIPPAAIAECVDMAKRPTELSRLLLQKLYARDYLAEHCVFGKGRNNRPKLDDDKVDAIIRFVLHQCPGSDRDKVVGAMNQLCADCRRPDKRKTDSTPQLQYKLPKTNHSQNHQNDSDSDMIEIA